MRRLIAVGLAAVLLLAAAPVALGLLRGLSRGQGASASSSLTCSVKPSCGEGEVAVLRMSGLANAHAQTAETHPKIYDWEVCCSGPPGLAPAPTGCQGTVLTLSAADNAHAASDGSYATQVTLWAPATVVDCTYGTACASGYSCLATISGTTPVTTNAHVADCDGVGEDYDTKVCCRAQPDMNSDSGPPPPAGYVGAIGNGTGISGDDATVPNGDDLYDACDDDWDNDGLPNATDPDPGGDMTYDDNSNGTMCPTDADDDGPSWDANCDGVRDGVEGSCPTENPAVTDTDGDGLKDSWEVCKWGTNPNVVDSDGDGKGDCIEAVDTNGNGIILGDFGADALNSAKASLLPAGIGAGQFGKDGDFDLNGNNMVAGDFGADTLTTAKMTLGILPCQ
jgi:hypothetical protein